MVDHLKWTPSEGAWVAQGDGTGMRYVIAPVDGGFRLHCPHEVGGDVLDFSRIEDAQYHARMVEGRRRVLRALDDWLAAEAR